MSLDDTPALARAPEDLFAGGGELGRLIRTYDWSKTPLGPPAGWPQSLKTAVRIMLTSRQPIWVGWGPALIMTGAARPSPPGPQRRPSATIFRTG